MTVRIIILDGATLNPGDNPWTIIEELGETRIFDRTPEPQIAERLFGAQIAVTNKTPLRSDTFASLPSLELVSVTATGYDCVDIDRARKLGIPVCNIPTYGTDSVAQFVFALLLEHCHHVAQHDAAVRDGEWTAHGAFSFWKTPQIELSGRTMGIIGFGRIGRRVGEIAHAFGMPVLACDELQGNPPAYEPFAWANAADIAQRSDIVTLHCNLTDSTKGIVSREFLQRMKHTAFLINAARGALVDEIALAEALNSGLIAGAALDVGSSEPIRVNNPLLAAKDCIITPHIAWSTLAARQRLMQTTAENIQAFLDGSPQNVVNAPI